MFGGVLKRYELRQSVEVWRGGEEFLLLASLPRTSSDLKQTGWFQASERLSVARDVAASDAAWRLSCTCGLMLLT